MKNIFAVAFITLLLFNSLGYYAFFVGMKYRHDSKMLEKFDNAGYRESEIVTIKIPIVIPYATESQDFVRVDGMFEYNKEFYRKVQQRFFQDTLHIQCIKDHTLTRMNKAWVSYVKTFSDSPTDHSSSHSKIFFSFCKDYLQQAFSILQASAGSEMEMLRRTSIKIFVDNYFPSILQPPQRLIS